MLSTQYIPDPGLLDLLACRGVNVNAQNCNGDSPLSIAALHGRTELLSIYYFETIHDTHVYIAHFLRNVKMSEEPHLCA